MDVFSRSPSREEEEEEDEGVLTLVALDKLPTYDRLRKGLLTTSKGGFREIDICNNLGYEERKYLLDKQVKVPEEDSEKLLLKLRSRIDTRWSWINSQVIPGFPDNVLATCIDSLPGSVFGFAGIQLPTIEVRFEHLNVEAHAYAGSRALPTILNVFTNVLKVLELHTYPTKEKETTDYT